MANGGESRSIVRATLATGEAVSVHESTQIAGTTPNSPHTIQHSEFILMREGTLAFEHDGISEQAGPGSIIYVAYGTLHTVRNVGTVAATYTVIAIGGDQK
ncbi:MAG: cupin domain-containing protein [Janthinobacterium lividum]